VINSRNEKLNNIIEEESNRMCVTSKYKITFRRCKTQVSTYNFTIQNYNCNAVIIRILSLKKNCEEMRLHNFEMSM